MPDTTIDAVLTAFAAAATTYGDAVNTEQDGLADDSRAAVIAVFAEFVKLVHDLNTGDKGGGETAPNVDDSAARVAARALFANVGENTKWLIQVISAHANKVVAELTAYSGGTAPGYSTTFDPAHADWGGPDAPVS
jgi:hypothetical protein